MPSLFSIDPEWLKQHRGGGASLEFTSQIGTPIDSMATAQSPGAGAAPVSQQGSMGFTPADQPKKGLGFMDFVGKLGDVMQSTGAGLQGRSDPVVARKNMESEMRARQQHLNLQKQQVELQKQRAEMQKLSSVWGLAKELGDRAQFDEPQAKALAEVMVGKSGLDPAWGGVLASGLQNKSDREMLERLFPNAVKEMGYPAASRLFKERGAIVQLREMEKQSREADSKKRAYRGKNGRTVSAILGHRATWRAGDVK